MVSPEFKSAVEDRNLLGIRIMLKDSLVIDPTFAQFDELFAYARTRLADIVEPFDGEILENDPSMWNRAEMDRQLVKLVNNFSEKRIQYVKAVVSKVFESDIKKIQAKKQAACKTKGGSATSDITKKTIGDSFISTRKGNRKNALRQITAEIRKMDHVLDRVGMHDEWRMGDVYDIENAAQKIMTAIQDYKKNR